MNKFIIISSILFLVFSVRGQDCSLNEKIELPAYSVYGRLPNGFQYFIKENNRPKESIELRLCLHVGSTQEEKGEEGIAHFLEHLAFEGSKNFPENEAVKYWESLGAKFGVTINAHTGYDRTVYTLTIPSENAADLEKTLHIFADWLMDLTLSPEAVAKQKGIIAEEIASYQAPEDLHTIKRGVSLQLKRLPVGTKAQIQQLTRQTINRFYKKWYAPQNAALIIVGNIDTAITQQTIKQIFGALKRGAYTVDSNREIPYDDRPLFFAQADTIKSDAKLSWIYPYYYNSIKTLQDLLDEYKTRFAVKLMAHRLNKEKMQVSRYWYLQKTGLLEFSVADKKEVASLFEKGFQVVEGLKEKGITKEEINALLPDFIEETVQIEDEKDSPSWAEDFVEMFLFNERQLATAKDENTLKKLLQTVTLAEWNTVIRKVFAFKRPELIIYRYNPEVHKKMGFNEVKGLYHSAIQNPNTRSVAVVEEIEKKIKIPDFLNAEIPFHLAMIEKERFLPDVGVCFIKLTNGAKLYLKPTKNDERLNLSFIFKGGLSLIPEDKFYEMEEIISYIGLGGIKGIKNEDFSNLLLQEKITFVNTCEPYYHGAMASAPLSKAKILCNLSIRKLLYPELCYNDFEEIKQDEMAAFKSVDNHKMKPLQQMDFRLQELKGNVFKRNDCEKQLRDIEQCDLDSLYAFYQKKYLSAQDMLCIATGSFQVDSIKKIMVGMLNQLPDYKNMDCVKKQDFSFDKEPIKEQIATDTTERLYYNIVYYGKYKNDLKNQLILKLMRDALRSRLLWELREKNKWVYSPYIELDFRTAPFSAFFFTINGTAQAKYCGKIESMVTQIIDSLKEKTIPQDELAQMKRSFLLTKQEYLSDYNSSQWRDYLQTSFKTGVTECEFDNYKQILKSITVDDILIHFQKLVRENQKKYLYIGNCITEK